VLIIPQAPTVSVIGTTIKASVEPNAKVGLYRKADQALLVTLIDNGDGIVQFRSVEPGIYYTKQSIEGLLSPASADITVIPEAPVYSIAGTSLEVTAKPGALVQLYRKSDRSLAANKTADESGLTVFPDLDIGIYYATQTVSGLEGGPTADLLIRPEQPIAIASGSTIQVKTRAQAEVKLFLKDTGALVATKTADELGNTRFSGVNFGTYFIKQTVSGIDSLASADVLAAPAAPEIMVNGNTIVVNGEPSTTIKLYNRMNNQVISTFQTDSLGIATFDLSEIGIYYVTQMIATLESKASLDIVIPPEPPAATVQGSTIDVNVRAYATAKLYRKLDGDLVASLIDNGGGAVQFKNVDPGIYNVRQVVTTIESRSSYDLTVQPPIPAASVNQNTIDVTGLPAAAVRLYSKSDYRMIREQQADSSGTVQFTKLDLGVYYVTQVVNQIEGKPTADLVVQEKLTGLDKAEKEANKNAQDAIDRAQGNGSGNGHADSPPGQNKDTTDSTKTTPPGQNKETTDSNTTTPPGQNKDTTDSTKTAPPGQNKDTTGDSTGPSKGKNK
jgi:hypothetical protein